MSFIDYDILVIGGGHAGLEAASIASQFESLKVALLTKSGVSIGSTPCNPAIGGVGKGQLVRELDVLGGLMPKLADSSAIQCRTLNESKGDAVRSTRFQVDKVKYSSEARRQIELNEGIDLIEAELVDIESIDGGFSVILSSGKRVFSSKVILTVGTFLGGRLHCGLNAKSGGRHDCPASISGREFSLDIKLAKKQFKTGTPARIYDHSVDFSVMEPQYSDSSSLNFSILNHEFERSMKQVACYKTRTTKKTIEIVLANKDNSPMFNGQIAGVGPRYCPSIEDKAYRYPDKFDHHIFVEPESLEMNTLYPNGISTSLPIESQIEMLRTIPGMEKAEIETAGYAVEYDVIDTSRLDITLCSMDYDGLYFAGQVNGTSGYEEAAGQGYVAGLNAALAALGRDPIVFPRGTSYIGVLIDDLVSNKRDEPYRLFTARAENRLYIREDNAVERLGDLRLSLGLSKEIDSAILAFRKNQNILARFFKCLDESDRDFFISASSSVKTNQFRNFLNEKVGISIGYREIHTFLVTKKYEGYIKRVNDKSLRYEKLDSRIVNAMKIVKNAPISGECKELIELNSPKTFFHLRNIKGIRPATITYVSSLL